MSVDHFLIAPRSAALQDFCKRASKTATSRVKETSLKKCVNPYLKSQFQSKRDQTQSQVHPLPEEEPAGWNWSPATLWRGVFVALVATKAARWVSGQHNATPWRALQEGVSWMHLAGFWVTFQKTRQFLGVGLGWRQIQMSFCDWFLGKPVAF